MPETDVLRCGNCRAPIPAHMVQVDRAVCPYCSAVTMLPSAQAVGTAPPAPVVLQPGSIEDRIARFVVAGFLREHRIDLSKDAMCMQRIAKAAAVAAAELRGAPTAEINLPFMTATQSGPLHLQMTVSLAKLGK